MTGTSLRLLVVDDHPLVRAGVRAELEAHAPDLEVVAEADDVEGAVAAVHALTPDVVLLDVHLPGGNGGGGPRWSPPATTSPPPASWP